VAAPTILPLFAPCAVQGARADGTCLAELVWLKEDPLLHAHGQVHTVYLFQTSLSMMVMGLIRQTKISFNIFYVTS
jgi:hypothetical protein